MTKHIGKRLAVLVLPVVGAATLPTAALEGSYRAAETAAQGTNLLETLGLALLATALSVAGTALARRKAE